MSILKQATEKTNKKDLAAARKITRKQVYKHINEEVEFNDLDKIKIWMGQCKNDVIINHLAEFSGGYFYREIKSKDGGFDDIAAIIVEFGEFVTALADSRIDGKVTRSELVKIKKEYGDLNALAQGLFLGIEKDLSK